MLPGRTLLNPPPVDDLLAELAAFGARIATLPAAPRLDWQRRPSKGEWSLTEVVCHLRDVEREVHQARFTAMIDGEGAFLAGVESDEWAISRIYRAQDGRRAAGDFAAARDKTIARLAALSPEMWDRRGQHTFFGPTSLQELVYLAVQHDRLHDRQIDDLMNDERRTTNDEL